MIKITTRSKGLLFQQLIDQPLPLSEQFQRRNVSHFTAFDFLLTSKLAIIGRSILNATSFLVGQRRTKHFLAVRLLSYSSPFLQFRA